MTHWERLQCPGRLPCYVPRAFLNDLTVVLQLTDPVRDQPTHAFIGTTTNQQQCWYTNVGPELRIMVPVVDFETVLARTEQAPTLRTAGNKPYYMLQGWDQCITLPQRHRDRLLSHMYAQRAAVAKHVEQYVTDLVKQQAPADGWN